MRLLPRATMLAIALTLAAGGVARATTFAFTATFNDPSDSDPLTASSGPAPFSTVLSEGHSTTAPLFMEVKTSDAAGGAGHSGSGRTNWDDVSLTLSWTAPSVTTTTFGGTLTEVTFNAYLNDSGTLIWKTGAGIITGTDDTLGDYVGQLVTFSNGAKAEVDVFSVDLSPSSLWIWNAGDLDGWLALRVTDKADPTPTPEPMSLALLGFGLLGVGTIRIFRRKTSVAI